MPHLYYACNGKDAGYQGCSKQSAGLFFRRASAVKRRILRIPSQVRVINTKKRHPYGCLFLVGTTGLSSQLSNSPPDCSPNRGTFAPLLEFVSRPVEKTKATPKRVWPLFGGNNRARTCDPLLVRQVLSQLSYAPVSVFYYIICFLIVK